MSSRDDYENTGRDSDEDAMTARSADRMVRCSVDFSELFRVAIRLCFGQQAVLFSVVVLAHRSVLMQEFEHDLGGLGPSD